MTTIVDVARRANVAISTVSNILNGTKYVSDEVREKVMAAIEELGYERDPVARNMKGAHSKTIGVVVTNGSRIFFSPILRSILENASSLGYTVMTFDSNDNLEWEKKYITIMCQNRFDGIILDSVASREDKAYFQWLAGLSYRNKRVYVTSIERDFSPYGIDSVGIDNYRGTRKMIQHLSQCGCKRLLHLAGPENSDMAAERMRGFYDECESSEMAAYKVLVGNFSPQSGYDMIENCIQKNELIHYDGIFAANDQMAVGAIKALLKSRIYVPDDIRVAGFDDTFVSTLIEPPLTTVHVDASAIGREAMQTLAARIAKPDSPIVCKWMDANLVVRVSTDRRAGGEWNLQSW